MSARVAMLREEFDFGSGRLLARLAGPEVDSGNGTMVPVSALTEDEYRWEPVPGCWSVRLRADGPGARATGLSGAGEWGLDTADNPHPFPPPFTTLAWRLSHLTELIVGRTNWTAGDRTYTRDDHRTAGTADAAIEAFRSAADGWRTLLDGLDDTALDTVGLCRLPNTGDGEAAFWEVAWWVNQELLAHGAEIALLRDLYREIGPR